jgi:dienelactone hydrolase
MLKIWLVMLSLFLVAVPASAQLDAAFIRKASEVSADLTFPAEIIEFKELSFFSFPSMAIYKPDGAGVGPFPAVVLHHSCGGLRSEIITHAKQFLAQGYVVFVLDSLGPRWLKTTCFPNDKMTISRGTKDAFQALSHLKKFPLVDSSRVAHLGFSWGGIVGLMLSSQEVASVLSTGERYAGVVSYYPMCFSPPRANSPASYEFLRPDVDKPLLVLMGDLDNETPPSDCTPRIDSLKAKNAPVESHLYPEATHCWDCISLNNQRKVDFKGNTIVYRYNKAVTEDAAKRTFEFFKKNVVLKN